MIYRTVYAPRPKKLTRQRLAILQYIDRYMREHGWAPSETEIRQELHMHGHSWLHCQLMTLAELGYIEFKCSMQMRVIRMPENIQ